MMRSDYFVGRQANAALSRAVQKGTPETRRDTAALEPTMHGDQLKARLNSSCVIKDRTAVWPLFQQGRDRMKLHVDQIMTNSVICQSPKMEIATRTVIRHLGAMSAKRQPILSEATRHEMTPERIGYRLGLLREALGLKPSEIADMLAIERTYWSRFEGGKRAITETMAALLVERFGVTLDFIVLGKWDKLPLDLAEKMRTVEAAKNI